MCQSQRRRAFLLVASGCSLAISSASGHVGAGVAIAIALLVIALASRR